MASLEKLIDERISRLESVPETLQTAIDKQSIELFKAIKSELNSLEIVDGKIVASSANFNRIGNIIEKLKQAVFNKDYVDAITRNISSLNKPKIGNLSNFCNSSTILTTGSLIPFLNKVF